MREYGKKYRATNKEKVKAADRRWREKNAEHMRAYNRRRYLEKRGSHLKIKYGISLADYEVLNAKQGGRCAICAADRTGGRGKNPSLFHVDHCHATGKVRGLLCNACNRMIGLGKDDPNVLRAGAAYLELNLQCGKLLV